MIYGWGTKNKKRAFIGRYFCRNCGGLTNFYVFRRYFYISLFFIPLFRITKGYYVGCENCMIVREIDKDEYLRLCEKYANFPKEEQVVKAIQDIKGCLQEGDEPAQLKTKIEAYCKFGEHSDYLDSLMDDLSKAKGN